MLSVDYASTVETVKTDSHRLDEWTCQTLVYYLVIFLFYAIPYFVVNKWFDWGYYTFIKS